MIFIITITMAVIHLLASPWTLALAPVALVLYYLVPYFITYGKLRGIPAPFPAQFSNLWLLSVVRGKGNRFEVVDEGEEE